jgi:hypothetical protein
MKTTFSGPNGQVLLEQCEIDAISLDNYTEYSIYCGFINTVGLYIRLSYFHPFQQFFIHIDKFYPFFIHYSSNLPTLNNVEKIEWPTVYAILGVLKV